MQDFLTGDDFYKKKFSNISLSGKALKGKEFENCIFDKCKFIDVSFNKCRFIECVFKNCLLSAIKPYGSTFNEIKFVDCKVIGVDWTKASRVLFLSFLRCNISYSNFSYLAFSKFKAKKCVAKEVSFIGSGLSGAVLTKTDFGKSRFNNTDLTGADFRKAYNYFIDIRFNKLKGARFSLPEASNLLKSLDLIIED
jgi:uncharacterized protein YjbI with pentapeptide repeats